MAIQKSNSKQVRRTDESILDEIRRSLWMEKTISAIDIHDISVGIESGQVFLSGHISKDTNNQRIEEITRSIPGVMAVHNHLVVDHDLSNQVAQALGTDERTCPFVLPVHSSHGWVELGGTVPDRDIQCAVEETAARVAVVRGVILLPNIKGENPSPVRSAVQPRIGVRVYGDDENEGMVYQVVINPQNRLVTHAIVRVNQFVNGWQKWCDYLIPVEAIRVVDAGGISLIRRAPVVDQFPVFVPVNYPFSPLTWQPPYPYLVGNVRWSRVDKENAEQRGLNIRKTAI